METIMIKKFVIILLMVSAMTIPTITLAGYQHGGYGCMGQNWNMTDLDTDGNGRLTFDEFTAPSMEKWQSGFDMIDTDGSKDISDEEWKAFLDVHGVNNG